MTAIMTVGHGTRTLDELAAVARGGAVDVVIDVRRHPGSRRHPQFGRDVLAHELPSSGIGYEWWGEALGGRRPARADSPHVALRNASFRGYADWMDTDVFRDALHRLVETAENRRIAVMCAETLWWRCHRRHIADAVTVAGLEVVHLITPGQSQPHRLHPVLRVSPDGRLRYDVGAIKEASEA